MPSLRPRSLLLLGTALVVGVAVPSHADPVTTSTLGWAINGTVSEVARSGNIAYVGGSFGSVAPTANLVFGFAAFSFDSATPVLPRLDINGRVRAVVALPGGGWLVGGEFSQVNGSSRGRLVKLLADGSVDAAFTATANGAVRALVVSGNRVFVGGDFTTVSSTSRDRLVALDAATGALDATFVPSFTGGTTPSIRALALSGTSVVVGGTFTMAGGMAHQNLAAVDATTGAVVGTFTGTADGRVAALAVAGADLIAAGEFVNIGGLARTGVARLDAATGAAIAGFDAQSNGNVSSVVVSGANVFVGGAFAQMGGASRSRLAQIAAATGVATTWNPGANANVEQMGLAGSVLVVAGQFTQVGGAERLRLAALDTTGTTNVALSWNPSLDSSADMLHVDGAGFVFAGGSFHYFGAVPRQNAAAIDLRTGDLLPWNPGPNGWVRALDIAGGTVYIGGDFTTIGGQSRHYIAALDGVTGVVSSWDPSPNSPVNGLQVADDVVFFVGNFTSVAAGSRGRGAAMHVNGTAGAWNPAADAEIEALFADGSRVYIGGTFDMVGGVARSKLAAVDSSLGTLVTAFAPSVTGSTPVVYRIDGQNGSVFFGGRFSAVNGSTRNSAAAVKGAPGAIDDGQLLGWNPDVSGQIYDLDAFGDNVYLAGNFGSVGGSSRPDIAMVDSLPNGGALGPWRPLDVQGGDVSVIDTSDTTVLFGGNLYDLNGLSIGAALYPEAGLNGIPSPPTTPRVQVRASTLTIAWAAPPLGARPTSYVIEGGTAPGLANLAAFSTGNAATSFSVPGLGAGTYYLRMRSASALGAGAASEEQAFVVGAAGCSGPPQAPLDLVATVAGSAVTLNWRAAPASIVSSYRLIIGATSGGSELGVADVGPGTTFSATAPSGAFFLRLFAVNACGVGAPSAETAVIVGSPVVPPVAPYGLAVQKVGGTLTFTWAAPSIGTSPFSYRLEAGSAPGLSNLATVPVGTTSFSAAGVPAGLYYVRVRAIGAGGTGPASNELVVQVP